MSNASGDDTPKEDGQELLRLLVFNEYRVGFARGAKNDDSEWAAKASEYRARLARHIARLEAPVSASGDDEELKHLLDALNKATLDASQAEELDEVRDAIKAKREARIAVESLFGRIREERDEARREAEGMTKLAGMLDAEQMEANEKVEDHLITLKVKEAELGRIREAALTPEEAKALLPLIVRAPNEYPAQIIAIEKLKLISGGALKEGATQ